MAASFIPALVLKHNDTVFLDTDLVAYGTVQLVPTPGAGGRPDGNYWAVPINNFGIVTGLDFVPLEDSAVAPTAQSFQTLRLITSKAYGKADYWYIRGTENDYINSSSAAECCDAPYPMPDDVPPLAGVQLMCQYNNPTDQQYFATFGVPVPLGFGDRYYAYGYFDGVALPNLSASGYLTPALLVSAMQSTWGATVGGTFTLSSDGLTVTLTQSAGDGTSEIGINIFTSVLSS